MPSIANSHKNRVTKYLYHYCDACMGEKPPATLTTTKVQCEGCSTWFVVISSSSDADNWKCTPLVLCIGHRFCFLLDLAIHCF